MSRPLNCQHMDSGWCINCIDDIYSGMDAYVSFRYGINAFMDRLSEIVDSDISDQDKTILTHMVLLSMRGLETKLQSALNTTHITREVTI